MAEAMDDDELIRRFDTNSLDAFPHELHVRLAQAKLARMPEADALESIRAGILRMAGNSGLYHETRTVAWVRLIALAKPSDEAVLMRRNLLDEFYTPAVLESGRGAFVEPDIGPLAIPRYYERRGLFYKVVGGRQFSLRNGSWQPMSRYKGEPLWWLISGDMDLERIQPSDLPDGAPL